MKMSRIVVEKVRLSYANVWTPKSINGGDEKYSVSILIDKNDKKTIDKINKAIEEAKTEGAAKFGGKIPKVLKTPLRDGDDERPDDENYAGMLFMNANSKNQPQIVDRKRQMILDQTEVYSGCIANVSVSFYSFNTNGNKGIACGLGNIQKVADAERLGGGASAEQDFEDLEDDGDVTI